MTHTPGPSAFQRIRQRADPHAQQMTRGPAADEGLTGYNEDAFNAEHWSKVFSDTIHRLRRALNRPQQTSTDPTSREHQKRVPTVEMESEGLHCPVEFSTGY